MAGNGGGERREKDDRRLWSVSGLAFDGGLVLSSRAFDAHAGVMVYILLIQGLMRIFVCWEQVLRRCERLEKGELFSGQQVMCTPLQIVVMQY